MATSKKPRAQRTTPKKCVQTVCGNTCIKTGYTCHDDDPKAKAEIKQKGKKLSASLRAKPKRDTQAGKAAYEQLVKDTNQSKRAVDREVEKASGKTPKPKRDTQAGKSAYEQIVKESKQPKRSKTETYNRGLAILEKYGGKDPNREKVDRDVEKASGKTRRKKQTESEKTQKILRREAAQRILRELQGESTPKQKSEEKKQKSKKRILSKPRSRSRRSN